VKDHEYITCRQLIDFIADYLDGELPADMRHEFERHLKVCPSCVAYLDGYKQTIRLGKMVLAPSDESAKGSVPEGLLQAIRAARRSGADPAASDLERPCAAPRGMAR
jgi:anti-sigma factor RsiW